MSISSDIKAHIPYLRRFSRALTGTREDGDAYVLAVLETLVADQGKIEVGKDLKIALYRLLLEIWRAAPINAHAVHSGYSENEAGARRNLDAISVWPRFAFLLSALEGFSLAEVGRISGECRFRTHRQKSQPAHNRRPSSIPRRRKNRLRSALRPTIPRKQERFAPVRRSSMESRFMGGHLDGELAYASACLCYPYVSACLC